MNTSAIVQTQNLSKKFGSINSVKKVDLYVQEGEIYGFLDPNGAGKTTTLKMLLGLIKPFEGTINSLNKRRLSLLQRTGFLIESPMLEIQKAKLKMSNVVIESSNQSNDIAKSISKTLQAIQHVAESSVVTAIIAEKISKQLNKFKR